MKWTKTDLAQFLQAQEYVDTILIPLIPFQFSQEKDMEKEASQSEWVSLFAMGIEKELAGRVMLVPSYHYLKSADKQMEIERLNDWMANIQAQPFKHIFYLTMDGAWKKEEGALTGNLLWFPMMYDYKNDSGTGDLLQEQIDQVIEVIRTFWA
ncbi:DUF2487 family protein [Lentibacillus saliphilus]|uniref:DUF2487 family protein n=1 Tax=Lentibacillus saliphilus TaxID=2737028 RepID=UPI001C2FE3AE|nr:DUF2487 family protein [Lentibacillus saliphilus]